MGSLGSKGFSGVGQPNGKDDIEWLKRVGRVVDNLLLGKLNITGNITLRAGAVSTTVSDARCSPFSVIYPMPTSADGGVALTTWSIRTRTNGSFTITHISTSTSTATASYSILG